jgi:branched-subunit amino acid transport protein AzlD
VAPQDQTRSDEGAQERLDRELMELLNELRVTLPGVQVLFAFLLTVPFTQRFDQLSPNTVDVYFAAVVASALASILLIAPAAHHRIRFRGGTRPEMIRVANVLALAGMISLSIALGAAVYVVADLVYGGGKARLAAAGVTGGAAIMWFVIPLFYRRVQRRP